MAKLHTRLKRKFSLSRSHAHKIRAKKKTKPKTFKTEDAARKWAEKNKIQNYGLINLKILESKSKKIKLILK